MPTNPWDILKLKIERLRKRKEKEESEVEKLESILEELKPMYDYVSQRIVGADIYIDKEHFMPYYSRKKYIIIDGGFCHPFPHDNYKGFLGKFLGIHLDQETGIYSFHRGEYQGFKSDGSSSWFLETFEIDLTEFLEEINFTDLRKKLEFSIDEALSLADSRAIAPCKKWEQE